MATRRFRWQQRFATEILEWSNSDIKPATEHPTPIEVVLEEYGEVLKPSHVVAGAGPDNKHDVLVQELAAGTAMDELLKGDGHGWEASPHHRFERLLKESEHPIGLLFNGEALRLIFAPRGESSGYITFPLEPMTTVAAARCSALCRCCWGLIGCSVAAASNGCRSC